MNISRKAPAGNEPTISLAQGMHFVFYRPRRAAPPPRPHKQEL